MKGLNKSINKYVLSAMLFTLIAVFLTVVLTINLIKNNIRTVYSDNGFIIDLEPKISGKLEKLSDLDGLSIKTNKINITNNNDYKKKYQILISPLNNYEDNIRVSLNNNFIRYLNNFSKSDGYYIIYEGVLESGYSIVHQISIWQSEDSNIKSISVDFKISIKIIDE